MVVPADRKGFKKKIMLGRTHFFVGTALSLAVMQPQSMASLVAGVGAAAIGSMISDIDSGTSQAHQEADKIMAASGCPSLQLL